MNTISPKYNLLHLRLLKKVKIRIASLMLWKVIMVNITVIMHDRIYSRTEWCIYKTTAVIFIMLLQPEAEKRIISCKFTTVSNWNKWRVLELWQLVEHANSIISSVNPLSNTEKASIILKVQWGAWDYWSRFFENTKLS